MPARDCRSAPERLGRIASPRSPTTPRPETSSLAASRYSPTRPLVPPAPSLREKPELQENEQKNPYTADRSGKVDPRSLAQLVSHAYWDKVFSHDWSLRRQTRRHYSLLGQEETPV